MNDFDYIESSVNRAESYFEIDKQNNTRPADLLADIMYYCRENNIDFEHELIMAEEYVSSEEQEMSLK
jgi:hypothetical protein